MAFIPALDCVKVAMHMSWNNQQVINTLWFRRNTPGSFTLADRTALKDNLLSWWNLHAKLTISADVALTAIEVINQESASAPSLLAVISPALPGTGSASVPLNAALSASFRTDLRGRNFRGRNYVPGVPQAALVDRGTVAVSNAAAIAAAWAKLSDPLFLTAAVQVIASHFFNKLPRASALLTPVVAVIVETLLDSMRRRLIGRGS